MEVKDGSPSRLCKIKFFKFPFAILLSQRKLRLLIRAAEEVGVEQIIFCSIPVLKTR